MAAQLIIQKCFVKAGQIKFRIIKNEMYKSSQVFFILLRMGVPWVCRMEHTFLLFLSLLAFLWVYQLGHRPSWRPFGHQEQTNGGPFPSSCFYCSFSLPFLFLVMSWNSNNIFLLGDAVQTDAVFTVKHLFGRQTGIQCS